MSPPTLSVKAQPLVFESHLWGSPCVPLCPFLASEKGPVAILKPRPREQHLPLALQKILLLPHIWPEKLLLSLSTPSRWFASFLASCPLALKLRWQERKVSTLSRWPQNSPPSSPCQPAMMIPGVFLLLTSPGPYYRIL